VVTVDTDWDVIPDNTSRYTIFGGWCGVFESVSNYSKIGYTANIKFEENVILCADLS
jgi:hypothetical protein